MADAGHLSIFLKCIEIQGFKSFADRLRLELGQGMSVIVGPNGSGKSNVADAVRWVLGEQSAKSLRGTKMEDVIFAGSVKRRPVGVAEVSLIFDNSTGIFPLAFQEVTITRRVYRDGEGQYFINKAQCRLKDIQELFMDTGAGKEGFSIIGQGRVEEILTLKSDERRALIEEAAGITKFRARKREALKRLEGTDQNLARLADILTEIEGRLEPLAGQAEIARQNIDLAEKQRCTEIQLVVGNLAEVRDKVKRSTENLEKLKERFSVSSAQLGTDQSQNTEKKLEMQALESGIQSSQSEVYQGEQASQELKHELELRRERARYLEEQLGGQKREFTELTGKEQKTEDKITALKSKESILLKTLDEVRAEVESREAQLSALRADTGADELERLKGELFSALSEQTNYSNELTGINHTKGSLEYRQEQLRDSQTKKRQEKEDLAESLHTLQEEENKLTETEAGCREQGEEKRTAISRLAEEQSALSTRQGELNREIDRWRARFQVLKSMENSMEGYQRGVREALVARKKGVKECAGICGTVAELLTVAKEYEVALETALGGGLQNVVTQTMEDAKQTIRYLKSRQLGRATFLPLDEIRGSRLDLSGEIKNDPSFRGLAVDLVRYQKEYRPAMEFLLGRIVIASDMDGATRIARMTGFRTRVVTLDGDQVNTGGSLSGGSLQRRGENLLGRSRELDELESKLGQGEKVKNELAEKSRQLDDSQNEIKAALQEIESRLGAVAEQRTRLKVNMENVSAQIRRLDSDLSFLKLQYSELSGEYEEISGRQTEAAARVEELEKRVLMLRERLAEREKKVKDSAGEAELLAEDLTKVKVRLATLEQEKEQAKRLLQEEQALKQENRQAIKQKEEQMAGLAAAREQLETERQELETALAQQEEAQLVKQQKLTQLKAERERISAWLTAEEEELRQQVQAVEKIKEQIHQEEINMARWETEWENGAKRLNEDFSLTWEEGQKFRPEQSRAALTQLLQDLKQQIEAMGPVNHAAIEEYPKTLERYEFLCAQRDDLVEARKKLHILINDLDLTMSEKFKEGFAAVDTAFRQVFAELFDGGHAELRLDNPENLLETGVEIIAQPPGKKPQHLSLLSGGERALTAIALLFALLKVKPSPFCILDEIEASLDDANVQRFAEYVRKLSHATQFLVISHRKGTMEAADTLYGITMEESGVSKLLTVQLDEDKPESA